MRLLIALFFASISTCSLAQTDTDKGIYFTLIPSEPFVYYITQRTEIKDYPEDSEYEDQRYEQTYKEFRPRRGLAFDLGYRFKNNLLSGIYGKVDMDMLDNDGPCPNIGVYFGGQPHRVIDMQARAGWYFDTGYNRNSFIFGGIFNFYFLDKSPRFDFGIRTGLYYTHMTDRREVQYNFNDYLEVTEYDIDWYLIDLGMFLTFH